MTTTIIFGNTSDIHNSKEYAQWIAEHPDVDTLHNITALPDPSPGLFTVPQDFIVYNENMKAADIRGVAIQSQESNRDVLMLLSKKPQGKYSGMDIEIFEAKTNSTKKNSKLHREAIRRTDFAMSAEKIVQQWELLEPSELKKWSHYAYDPFAGDLPPWGVTNAIISGKPQQAVEQCEILLKQKASTPQSVCMSLTGFFRKVLIEKNNKFFTTKRKRLKDTHGIVEDMAYYPQEILSSGKNNYIVYAYVASLAGRFR